MREINECLYNLKFYKGDNVSDAELDIKNLPEDIIYSHTGKYVKIQIKDAKQEDLDKFLKVKNAYNINVIKNCVLTCTIFFALMACALLITLW